MEFSSVSASQVHGRLLLAVVSVAIVACAFASQAFGSFGPATDFAVGISPESVAIGDLNGDNNRDLAVANYDSDTVSVLLGDGTGSFGPRSSFDVGSATEPTSVAIGDLNGDNNLDLAVAGWQDVAILLGNGTGSFGAATHFDVGSLPHSNLLESVAIGDLNGDGKPDLAVANGGSPFIAGEVAVLLGTGTGSFGAPSYFTAGPRPLSVAISDLNGDSFLDLATANVVADFKPSLPGSNTVSVLLGDGTGSFGTATNFATAGHPLSVAVGNLNGDSNPDLAVAAWGGVSVLLGTGNGAFAPATNFEAGTRSESVAIGDLDGDNNLDLAVANPVSNSDFDTVSVLVGTGTGSFVAATDITVGNFPNSVAIGNLNGDNNPDLAVANRGSNNVSVVLRTDPPPPGTAPPPGTVYNAEIKKVKVKGPAKVKRKKKATYKVRITNSGNATATGVRLKVKGRGVSFNTSVGKIGAKKTRTVKVRLKARKAGKVKVSFKVTSKNAGGKTVKKKITVRK